MVFYRLNRASEQCFESFISGFEACTEASGSDCHHYFVALLIKNLKTEYFLFCCLKSWNLWTGPKKKGFYDSEDIDCWRDVIYWNRGPGPPGEPGGQGYTVDILISLSPGAILNPSLSPSRTKTVPTLREEPRHHRPPAILCKNKCSCFFKVTVSCVSVPQGSHSLTGPFSIDLCLFQPFSRSCYRC